MSEETHKKIHDEKHLDKLTIKELRDIAAEFPHERAIHDMKKEELIAFIKAAHGGKFTTAEIAERAGLTLDQARDVIVRGRQAKRIEIHDEDRQHIWIEVLG